MDSCAIDADISFYFKPRLARQNDVTTSEGFLESFRLARTLIERFSTATSSEWYAPSFTIFSLLVISKMLRFFLLLLPPFFFAEDKIEEFSSLEAAGIAGALIIKLKNVDYAGFHLFLKPFSTGRPKEERKPDESSLHRQARLEHLRR